MLIEPVSEELSVVMNPGLKVGPKEPARPVAEPDNQPVNADDDVPDDLKAAYHGEYNNL